LIIWSNIIYYWQYLKAIFAFKFPPILEGNGGYPPMEITFLATFLAKSGTNGGFFAFGPTS
jgi:hypothetical protein